VYHQSVIFSTLSRDRILKTYKGLADVWFAGIERQHVVQTEAIRRLVNSRMENVRTLSDSTDPGQFAIRALSFAAFEPLELVAVASELGGIAVETHNKAMELLQRTDESSVERSDVLQARSDEAEVRGDRRGSKGRKLQMMA